MYQNQSVLAREPELAVGSRMQVVKGALADLAGHVIAIRGDRLLVAPQSWSRGFFVEIDRSVTETFDVSPEERLLASIAAG